MSHTCINCNVRFQDPEMQREHYKTVWNFCAIAEIIFQKNKEFHLCRIGIVIIWNEELRNYHPLQQKNFTKGCNNSEQLLRICCRKRHCTVMRAISNLAPKSRMPIIWIAKNTKTIWMFWSLWQKSLPKLWNSRMAQLKKMMRMLKRWYNSKIINSPIQSF